MKIKCNKCGNEINNTNFCPYCGNQINNVNPNVTNDSSYLLVGIFLIIFFPIVGIIFCAMMSSRDSRFKKVLLWYGIGVAVIVILFILFVFLLLGLDDKNSYQYKCKNYCNGSYVIEGNSCVCDDGRTYDIFEDENNNNNNNSNNDNEIKDDEEIKDDDEVKDNEVNDNEYISTEFNKDEWMNTVNSNEYVINVIAASWCPHCQNYKPIIMDVAKKLKIKLYFIESDKLSSDDYKAYTTTYELSEYDGNVPFTFITHKGNVLGERVGEMGLDETINFINSVKQYM